MADNEGELLDYEEDEETVEAPAVDSEAAVNGEKKKDVKGSYVSIHSSGFKDFLLKPEMLRAIVDCGFEHPSAGNYSKLLQLALTCRIMRMHPGFRAFFLNKFLDMWSQSHAIKVALIKIKYVRILYE